MGLKNNRKKGLNYEIENSCPSKHCICTPAKYKFLSQPASKQAMNLYSRTNFNMDFAPHTPKKLK